MSNEAYLPCLGRGRIVDLALAVRALQRPEVSSGVVWRTFRGDTYCCSLLSIVLFLFLAVDEVTEAFGVCLVRHLHKSFPLMRQTSIKVLLHGGRVALIVQVHIVSELLRQHLHLPPLISH